MYCGDPARQPFSKPRFETLRRDHPEALIHEIDLKTENYTLEHIASLFQDVDEINVIFDFEKFENSLPEQNVRFLLESLLNYRSKVRARMHGSHSMFGSMIRNFQPIRTT